LLQFEFASAAAAVNARCLKPLWAVSACVAASLCAPAPGWATDASPTASQPALLAVQDTTPDDNRRAAQEAATIAASGLAMPNTRLDEVIVSARRRDEDAQNVPVPIAAVSGAALEHSGQYRLEDLNAQLPSTNVEFANPRQSSIAVRGLGNNPANDALESSVGGYLDNVYLGRASMANMDLIDIDQVALLRGPQGTLFGKNTTAGVLNIKTREPSFKPETQAEASIGNEGYYQLRASTTGALVDDTLAQRARQTLRRRRSDGRRLAVRLLLVSRSAAHLRPQAPREIFNTCGIQAIRESKRWLK
jgi:iron complex outermembrane receptor protein